VPLVLGETMDHKTELRLLALGGSNEKRGNGFFYELVAIIRAQTLAMDNKAKSMLHVRRGLDQITRFPMNE
jgi:hypothetical protein